MPYQILNHDLQSSAKEAFSQRAAGSDMGAIPREVSRIEAQMNRQRALVAALHDAINKLETRLDPVLTLTPQLPNGGAAEDGALCALAREMAENSEATEIAIDRIHRLIDRLQV